MEIVASLRWIYHVWRGIEILVDMTPLGVRCFTLIFKHFVLHNFCRPYQCWVFCIYILNFSGNTRICKLFYIPKLHSSKIIVLFYIPKLHSVNVLTAFHNLADPLIRITHLFFPINKINIKNPNESLFWDATNIDGLMKLAASIYQFYLFIFRFSIFYGNALILKLLVITLIMFCHLSVHGFSFMWKKINAHIIVVNTPYIQF